MRIIGILGGMGPQATAELFFRIIKATPASKDQDHLRIIIDNNPQIPDRTSSIMSGGLSPLPEMVKTARNLEKAGAEFIIIPCNTAHYFYEDLRKNVQIRILNMMELTASRVRDKFPKIRRVGLLATTGTIKTRLYHQALNKFDIAVIAPENRALDKVMEAINCIKSGNLRGEKRIILRVASRVIDTGVEALICGCTEVSLVLENTDVPVPVIDPLQILAESSAEYAQGK